MNFSIAMCDIQQHSPMLPGQSPQVLPRWPSPSHWAGRCLGESEAVEASQNAGKCWLIDILHDKWCRNYE